MSLKAFHIFFIGVSAVLAAGMCLWGIRDYSASHNSSSLALVIVGGIMLALLIPYIRWFRQKMKRLASAASLLVTALLYDAGSASACPVCYGDPNSLMTLGVKSGILFLIVVVAGVLAAILGIALTWAKRARALE